MSLEEFGRLCQMSEKPLTAKKELKQYNIVEEYEAIARKESKSAYDNAMLNIFQYIMTSAKHDPVNGDYWNEANNELMKQAGELLNKDGGKGLMHDTLLAWIPPRYRRSVDSLWDGIGGWAA
jgi:hypothetical protein